MSPSCGLPQWELKYTFSCLKSVVVTAMACRWKKEVGSQLSKPRWD